LVYRLNGVLKKNILPLIKRFLRIKAVAELGAGVLSGLFLKLCCGQDSDKQLFPLFPPAEGFPEKESQAWKAGIPGRIWQIRDLFRQKLFSLDIA